MLALWNYLRLPREITDFERRYVTRMNRIALVFFLLHIPVFAGVAVLAGTSVVQALVLTPLVLAGPCLAYVGVKNPRVVSTIYGVTAMLLGGLLVHFGQGPMQIEMHFYFFVLLALLAVFGNPLVIVAAAATAAVHHLTVWLLLPASVFNYEASFWTVAVHAAFVVLESVAAVFVARSFFDNVIGLEKIVGARTAALDARNRDMRIVLENVQQGFVTVDPSGAMSAERSAILGRWLGAPPASGNLFDYLAAVAPDTAAWMRLGWESVFDDVLPIDLALDQLPRRLALGGRHFEFGYQPVAAAAAGPPAMIVVVVSDVSAVVERERAEQNHRELLAVFERFGKDRAGFLEFYQEADDLVSKLATPSADPTTVRRLLHTLKGNAAIFGVDTISATAHELETRLGDDHRDLTDDERTTLVGRWGSFKHRVENLLGRDRGQRVELEPAELERLTRAIRDRRPVGELLKLVQGWQLEPVEARLERIAEQTRRVASRLGKDVDVRVEGGEVRLDPARWVGFWSALVHAVRNAVDHGVELPADRAAAGKAPRGQVALSAALDGEEFIIEIADDGRGIDWDRVATKAAARGLHAESPAQLAELLFVDGLSTRDEASDTSGRGIGMSALRAACEAAGGRLTISSDTGHGTRLQFRFPAEAVNGPAEVLDLTRISQRLGRISNPS
jgi:two-component system chemotaxis sensor kinase CheA